MKKLLNQKEQHIAYTRKEAEEIVETAKENAALTMNKISEKYNKHGQYFLIDLTYTFNTPKEVMESNPRQNDAPDGQMSIDEVHEGVPYTVNLDGSVKLENQDEKLPDFEDPFAGVEEKKDDANENMPF
ncbi:organic solvent tolerance protein OstA [Lysinibacillus mangiferihumi]|uniref:organic solvent tolerance protein OstA n=1 Tax=Lysinibacillus mangiferihumi TaxID=1130819 RepID=UPI001F181B42|nr:organic solvent tolerance protein OstA [Lysinibacillus mangiferihumi]